MNVETGLSIGVSDLDFSSLYPSIMRAINSSRITMRFAPFAIEKDQIKLDVRRYFVNLINVRENAVLLCSEFHGLPTYSEMSALIAERINTTTKPEAFALLPDLTF